MDMSYQDLLDEAWQTYNEMGATSQHDFDYAIRATFGEPTLEARTIQTDRWYSGLAQVEHRVWRDVGKIRSS